MQVMGFIPLHKDNGTTKEAPQTGGTGMYNTSITHLLQVVLICVNSIIGQIALYFVIIL